VPDYLKNGWGEERWSRIARFRLGNEVEERKHWEEGEKKSCRLCGRGEMETWEYIWEGCRKWMVSRVVGRRMYYGYWEEGEGRTG